MLDRGSNPLMFNIGSMSTNCKFISFSTIVPTICNVPRFVLIVFFINYEISELAQCNVKSSAVITFQPILIYFRVKQCCTNVPVTTASSDR